MMKIVGGLILNSPPLHHDKDEVMELGVPSPLVCRSVSLLASPEVSQLVKNVCKLVCLFVCLFVWLYLFVCLCPLRAVKLYVTEF